MNQAQQYLQDNKKHIREYVKFGNVIAQQVPAGTKVDTVIEDKLETTNIAKEGDWKITGVKGEQYLIANDKFKSRYEFVAKTPRGDKYRAIGNVFALQYKGKSFTFKAPWGEAMICDSGDYICTTTLDNMNDVYRIEKDAFVKTYKRK